jgi:hypothetical protein
MTVLKFDELNWVSRPSKIESPEPGDIDAVAQMKTLYPEISDWSDYAIYLAWGQFCQDLRMISWINPDAKRDPLFLGYLHYNETSTDKYNWGSSAQAEESAKSLGLIK